MSTALSNEDLAAVLHAIQHGDESDTLLDNAGVARVLGLSLEVVAERLAAGKEMSLVWGIRNGQRPAPWYTDLELTVQGRRFLAANPVG
jgi:hypothetical protein